MREFPTSLDMIIEAGLNKEASYVKMIEITFTMMKWKFGKDKATVSDVCNELQRKLLVEELPGCFKRALQVVIRKLLMIKR